jgi:hypothetical protein
MAPEASLSLVSHRTRPRRLEMNARPIYWVVGIAAGADFRHLGVRLSVTIMFRRSEQSARGFQFQLLMPTDSKSFREAGYSSGLSGGFRRISGKGAPTSDQPACSARGGVFCDGGMGPK